MGIEGWPLKVAQKLGMESKVKDLPDTVQFLFVNTAYDKELIGKWENGVRLGNEAVTDRGKLASFLEMAQKAGNYRFIFIDLDFDKREADTEDTMLARQNESLSLLVSNMRDVYVARGVDAAGRPIAMMDSWLSGKSGLVTYSLGLKESGFSGFPLLCENNKSIPLMLAENFDGITFDKREPFYVSNGRIARKKVSPKAIPDFEYRRDSVGYGFCYGNLADVVSRGDDSLQLKDLSTAGQRA